MFLLLTLAIMPTVLIMLFILKFDKYQKEPASLLVKLFLLGMLSVIPAIVGEYGFEFISEELFGWIPSGIFTVLDAFFCIALVEEFVKFAAVKLFGYKHSAYDEVYDGMIYCVTVSLGFATVENVIYVMQYGLATAVVRAVTSVPAHAMFALSMGYFMSLSKFLNTKKKLYRVLTLVSPVLLHGMYDSILLLNFDYALLMFVPFVVVMYVKSVKLIKEISAIPPVLQQSEKPYAVVAAALIWNNGKFMICQRPEYKDRGLMWEFVGGKTEADETAEDALIRECKEELDITVKVQDEFMRVSHSYPDIDIDLILFNADIESGTPTLLEHNDMKYISPYEIDEFEFCPADDIILKKIKEVYCE